jgi:uncharacterized OsmC-like protein
VPVSGDRLLGEAEGEIEADEDKVLLIKRIHVRYRLKARPEHREAAERAHEAHARYCPVARSLAPGIAVTTALEFEEVAD